MAATEQARLAAELQVYALRKKEWLKGYPGRYVVIRGDQVLNFFPTFEAAYSAGAARGVSTQIFL